MIRTTGITVAAAILLAGCGGDQSATCGDCPDVPPRLETPQNLTAEADGDQVTLTWDSVPNASGYQVYVSSDPDMKIENYAAYGHSEWIQDAESPLVWTIPEWGYNYTIAVTATAGSRETDPAKTGVVGIFQVSPDDSSVVIDHSSGLEWKRCSEGQTWDEPGATCLGDPTEYPDTEVLAEFDGGGPDGWRIPAEWELGNVMRCQPPSPRTNNTFATGSGCAKLDEVFPNRGLDYPPYFVRKPIELPRVCRMALSRITSVCQTPPAGAHLRALMVRNAE